MKYALLKPFNYQESAAGAKSPLLAADEARRAKVQDGEEERRRKAAEAAEEAKRQEELSAARERERQAEAAAEEKRRAREAQDDEQRRKQAAAEAERKRKKAAAAAAAVPVSSPVTPHREPPSRLADEMESLDGVTFLQATHPTPSTINTLSDPRSRARGLVLTVLVGSVCSVLVHS